jgi:DNA-binding transcriptional ArsR family regulator
MSTAKNKRVLSDEELEQIALHFRLLGEPMRLKILQAVCGEPLTVNDIVAAVGATQANVSKHLSLLAAAGILTRKKDGQCVYYGMKDPLTMKLN